MRNRVKCKKCQTIIESFHSTDMVMCKCESIAIDGGPDKFQVYAHDFNDIIRIDDEDKEIAIKVVESTSEVKEEIKKPSKEDLLEMLNEMIKSYERLPSHAMSSYVTNYDLCASLLLISSIFRADCKD